jgi:hypothetical protein
VAVSFEERFWMKVRKTEGCWTWTAKTMRSRPTRNGGYGIFRVYGVGRARKGSGSRTEVFAHRVSWELAYGPVPAGLMVCHHCDNPPCVRPDHLFLGTAFDNMADAATKGRLSVPHRRDGYIAYWADPVRSAAQRQQLRQTGRARAAS